MTRHLTRRWLENSTAVVVNAGTCHMRGTDAAACGEEGGRPTTLVQALVYLDLQWCTSRECFPGGRP